MTGKLLKSTLIGAMLVTAVLLAPAAARAAELLMFERDGCVWCARWNRDVAPVYALTDEARLLPLRRINIDHAKIDDAKSDGLRLAAPVRFTPTFVAVHNGHEVGRITGYSNDEAFWGLLGALAAKVAPLQPGQT